MFGRSVGWNSLSVELDDELCDDDPDDALERDEYDPDDTEVEEPDDELVEADDDEDETEFVCDDDEICDDDRLDAELELADDDDTDELFDCEDEL